MAVPAYPEFIEESARAYREYLRRVREAGGSEPLLDVVRKLDATIERAQAAKDALVATDVVVSVAVLSRLTTPERAVLLNDSALGLGSDGTEVVVIGTEHGYDLHLDQNLPNFCLEACANAVLWLTGGKQDIVSALTNGVVATERPHCIYPNDHHDEGGGHTWVTLAKALGVGHEPGSSPNFGDRSYQIDLSSYPAQKNKDGKAPSEARVKFLESILERMTKTARVLLLHGRPDDIALWPARQRLIEAFLGGSLRRL